MTEYIIRKFISNPEDVNNPAVRSAYGMLSGIVGVICNILLSSIKFVIGFLTGSISVTVDAANNLSDAASSVVTLAGMKIANKPADKDHPFGHGRLEYIAALIVAFMIVIMGFELLQASFGKIISPGEITFNGVAFAILIVSIPLKLYLAFFNKRLAEKTGSLSFKAVMSDSLSDCVATAAVAVSILVNELAGINTDGYIGIVVALLIMKAGVDIIREIISPLLGQIPDASVIEGLEKELMSYDEIVGIHDLILHDYGPGRIIGSVHAEVPADIDLLEIHDVIDNAERRVKEENGILLAIHMDPIVTNDEKINRLKSVTLDIVRGVNPDFTIHDFRMVEGPTHTNLIFDLVIPYDCRLSEEEILKTVSDKISEVDKTYYTVIEIEHKYV